MAQVKVQLITPRGGLDFSHQPGEVIEVDTKTAARMIKAGQATRKIRETARAVVPSDVETAVR